MSWSDLLDSPGKTIALTVDRGTKEHGSKVFCLFLVNSNQLTVNLLFLFFGSRFTVHGSRFTVHGSRFTVHVIDFSITRECMKETFRRISKKGQDTDISRAEKWLCLLAVGLGVFMGTVDVSIVNVSLPTLVEDLETDFATIQWVILSYVLVVTSLMLGAARLGDMYPKKYLYGLGLVIFTIGSFLCGFSPNVYWLIAFRALQGFGAVMLQALGMAIIVEIFPGHERGRAMGLLGSIVSVGLASGPALGGVIVGSIGWPWIFWVNVPLGFLALIAVLLFVPLNRVQQTGQSFDLKGTLILMVSLASYALAMTRGQNIGFDQPVIKVLLAVFALGMLFFLIVQRRMKQPMVDLSLFKNILFSLGILLGFATFIILGGTMFLLPFFLQDVQKYSIHMVGVLLMVVPVAEGLIAPLAGWLSDHFGPYGIRLAGGVVIVLACFLLSTLQIQTSILGYILKVAPLGFGIGIFQATNNSAVMGAVPLKRLGISSGLLALSRNMGVTTGLPIIGALFTASVLSVTGTSRMDIGSVSARALESGFFHTFQIAGLFMCLAAALGVWSLWISIRDKRRKSRHPEQS